MKNKRIVTTILVICLIFNFISVFEINTLAAEIHPNKYTYVRNAPYWFASVVDQFSTAQVVTPIEREGSYAYIEYRKDGKLKSGYMPLVDLSNVSLSWCNHTEFNPGKSAVSTSITMYYGPNSSTYGVVATLPSSVGTTSNNPLLILSYSGSYARVQYVSNYTTTTNSVQPQYCRGWILRSKITPVRPSASSYLETSVITMIRNVSNNKYLTVVESDQTSTGYNVVLSDPTGLSNQHWRISKYTHSSGGVYYKIISVSTGLCLQVQDAQPLSNNPIELEVPGDPDKSQEFEMSEISNSIYNGITVGKNYKIKTRMTGSYQCLDVNSSGAVQLRINSNTSQTWSVERFNKFWSNSYNNLPKSGNTYTLKYYINRENGTGDVYHQAYIYDSDVEIAVNKWNIRDSEQNTYVNISRTYNKTEAKVIIEAKDIGIEATARCMPAIVYNNTELQSTDYLTDNWDKSYVQLNSNNEFDGSFNNINVYDAKMGVACHEFGHALKLTHPYGELDTNHIDQVVYSVMNQGVFKHSDGGPAESKVEYEPTVYDKQNLLNKWRN